MIDKRKLDDFVELREAMAEAEKLTTKSSMTAQDRNRFAYLLAKISILKSGASSAQELREDEVNRAGIEMGKLPHNFKLKALTSEQKQEARMWQAFVATGTCPVEFRDQGTGAPAIGGGTGPLQGNLGAFVPFDFFYNYLPVALRQWDPLFDEGAVSYLETTHGKPIQVPNVSAIDSVATIVAESAQISEIDTDSAGAQVVRGFAFKTPLWRVSIEAFQDLEASYGVIQMFKRFAAQRIALGAGAKLLKGTGVGEPSGLVTSLVANFGSNAFGRIAVGSSSNTGGSETGVNSVGSDDLYALFYSVNAAYRTSEKCAWLMNSNTMAYIAGLKDKMGRPLIALDSPTSLLLGKKVWIAPSMPDIGAAANTIVFGDLSYWLTRCAKNAGYIKLYKEAPGLIEKGEVGLRAFVRYDGVLLYGDSAQVPPIRMLQHHS